MLALGRGPVFLALPNEPIPVDDTFFDKVLAALDQSLYRRGLRLKHYTGVIKLVESECVATYSNVYRTRG